MVDKIEERVRERDKERERVRERGTVGNDDGYFLN